MKSDSNRKSEDLITTCLQIFIMNQLFCVGLPRLNDLFDVCNPFLPTVAGVSDGRDLRIRFETNNGYNAEGFLMRYFQQGFYFVQLFIHF